VSDVHDEYVAGDINQIDDADDFDDYVEESSGNAEKALKASTSRRLCAKTRKPFLST